MKKFFSLVLAIMLVLTMTSCSQESNPAQPNEVIKENVTEGYKAGTYEGKAVGRHGEITVEVTLSEKAIDSVKVTDHHEQTGLTDLSIEQIPKDIVTYQSLGVDTVSGATITSYAVINAVTDALKNAGVDTDALKKVEISKEEMPTEDMSTQVVIAGGGMSGLLAAISASHAGADVVLVEKLPFLGGSLMVAGGGNVTVGSEVIGSTEPVNDDLQRTMDYMRMVNETSERQPDYEFVEYLLGETGKTVDYLVNEFGLEATYTDRGDYIRTYYGDGAQQVKQFASILKDEGVTVLLNTRAEEIVMNNGKAVGLKVANESGDFTITADKIIIATGGASWDKERLLVANPELNTVALSEQASVGNSGDGFAMLEKVGAKMGEGPFIKSAYPDFSLAFGFTWRNNPVVSNNLVVDAEGKRFANEAPYNSMMLNKNMLRHESPKYYAIFDAVNTDEKFLPLLEEMSASDNPNIVVHADTIEELAEKIDIDPASLKSTFDRYQEMCVNGKDDDFGKEASHLIPYDDKGGYYAAYIQAASWGTIGGTITDFDFHVLNENNEAIENLFAVGESATSTLFGDYYLGGFSLGFYSTAGRLAGQTAVEEINANK